MKNLFLLLIAISLLGMISCGEKYDELKNVAEVIKNAPAAAEKIGESVDLAEKKREERRKRGDTLALHFDVLMKYLPESLPGFVAGEPNGQRTNITGFSMSTAEREFTTDDGTGRRVRITLMDYNESYAMFGGVAYWANLGISTETSDGFQRSVKTNNDNIAGFEEFSKKNKFAKVSFAIGYRFLLNIEENEATSIDFIKGIADNMKLKELSNL